MFDYSIIDNKMNYNKAILFPTNIMSKDESYQTDTEEAEEPEELDEKEELEKEELEKDEKDEKEYESESDQDSEEEEKEPEEETYNDEDLLEELYEENEDVDTEETVENDPPDEVMDAGDDDNDFEEKRKRPVTKNRKDVKKRLFPFIQKDRRLARANERNPPDYWGFDMRDATREFLEKLGGLTQKGYGVMENAIYSAANQHFQLMNIKIPEDDSVEFKKSYWNILRHVIGAWKLMNKKEILEEVKSNKWGLKSKLFTGAQETEQLLEQKIRQPDEVTEDSNYPCPKCKGIKHTRLRVQDRSGDEAGSLRLWCSNSSCGHGWRITG